MIIVAIVALSGVVLAIIYTVFVGIPSLPSNVTNILDQIIGYVVQGEKLAMSFVYGDVVVTLASLTVTVIGIYEGYKLVMWIVRKIPMFGVSD